MEVKKWVISLLVVTFTALPLPLQFTEFSTYMTMGERVEGLLNWFYFFSRNRTSLSTPG